MERQRAQLEARRRDEVGVVGEHVQEGVLREGLLVTLQRPKQVVTRAAC